MNSLQTFSLRPKASAKSKRTWTLIIRTINHSQRERIWGIRISQFFISPFFQLTTLFIQPFLFIFTAYHFHRKLQEHNNGNGFDCGLALNGRRNAKTTKHTDFVSYEKKTQKSISITVRYRAWNKRNEWIYMELFYTPTSCALPTSHSSLAGFFFSCWERCSVDKGNNGGWPIKTNEIFPFVCLIDCSRTQSKVEYNFCLRGDFTSVCCAKKN